MNNTPNPAKKATEPLCIGAGLPLVPHKLVMRIQVGEFIDMAELLSDRLGSNPPPPTTPNEEDRTTPKSKEGK